MALPGLSQFDQFFQPEPTPPLDLTAGGDDLVTLDLAGNLVSTVRMTGASSTINGLVAGVNYGRRLHVMAVGGPVVLVNNAGTSQAANRIVTGTGSNVTVATGAAAWLVYDSSAQVWRLSGAGAGGASFTPPTGDGVVTVTGGALNAAGTNQLALGTGFVSFGTTPAASGTLRYSYPGGSITTVASVKNSSAADTPFIRTGAGDAVMFGNVGQDCSLVSTINGFVAFGTTPSSSGLIRVSYAGGGTVNVVSVKNSTGTDTPIVSTGPGDACTLGNASLDLNLRGITFSALISSGGISSTTGKQLVYSNAVSLWLGALDSTGTSNHTITTISAATAIEFWAPLRGITSGTANKPLSLGTATIPVVGSTTLTQAQYANPSIIFTGTPGATTQTFPHAAAGLTSIWVITNGTNGTMTITGGTGATVTIASAGTSIIISDGTNMRRIS